MLCDLGVFAEESVESATPDDLDICLLHTSGSRRRPMRMGAHRGRQLHSRVALLGLVAMVGAIVAVPSTAPKAAADTTQCPWMDARQSADQRAGELVAAMTTGEKLSMLYSAEPTMAAYYGTAGHVAAIPR